LKREKPQVEGKKTWSNYYWFYYKPHIIFGLIFSLMIIVCTAQCASQVKPDCYVVFSTDSYIPDNILTLMTDEMEELIEDQNGDGEIKIQPINCTFNDFDTNGKNTARQQAMLQVQSKEVVLWFLDETALNIYYNSEDLDIYGTNPAFTEYDNHAIKIADTSLQKTLDEFELHEEIFIFCRKNEKGECNELGEKIALKLSD